MVDKHDERSNRSSYALFFFFSLLSIFVTSTTNVIVWTLESWTCKKLSKW